MDEDVRLQVRCNNKHRHRQDVLRADEDSGLRWIQGIRWYCRCLFVLDGYRNHCSRCNRCCLCPLNNFALPFTIPPLNHLIRFFCLILHACTLIIVYQIKPFLYVGCTAIVGISRWHVMFRTEQLDRTLVCASLVHQRLVFLVHAA